MKRLFLSIAIALAFHGLILSFDPGWLKRRSYKQIKPSHVTISLNYLPPAVTAKEIQSVRVVEKKSENIKPGESGKTEKLPDLPAEQPNLSGDSIKPVYGVTESETLMDLPPSVAGKKHTAVAVDSEAMKQSYESRKGETMPVHTVIKEAVPLYKENPPPVYPMQAKNRGYEGTVILEVLVTKEGKAGKVSVFQSSRYSLLDDAAVSSVKKWRFEPGKKGDEKVDMPVKIPIRFKLEIE